MPAALSVWTTIILHRAEQRAQKLMQHYLDGAGIQARQYVVLALLFEEETLSQIDLSRRLHIDRTSMVFLVDELEQAGLVVRGRAPHDRRKYAIMLTEHGKATLGKANERMRSAEDEFLEPLSAAERDHLRALLLRLT